MNAFFKRTLSSDWLNRFFDLFHNYSLLLVLSAKFQLRTCNIDTACDIKITTKTNTNDNAANLKLKTKGYICESDEANVNNNADTPHPTGIANNALTISSERLCMVQKFEISNILKPINLKMDICLFCSIKAFCDMMTKITRPMVNANPERMIMNTFSTLKLHFKIFHNLF